ncbi:MAG TPA: carbohydrate porin [Rhodocyclaceae bacterium]|nr:carbohydrate porin [Rhodocyclaceae bacterium]
MKKSKLLIALSVAGALGNTAASAATVDFSGYFRAGTGINTQGGTMTCYKLPGADTKWRLGNECDYVIEPNFNATLATLSDKSEWHVHFMPSVYRAWGTQENGTASDELLARYGQVYAYGSNIPQLANGTVWAGRRFYNRLQLNINDQFLENNDGDGAGLENMNLGFGKLSLAFMMNPRVQDTNDNRFAFPFRLTNIRTFSEANELAIYTNYEHQSKSTDQVTNVAPEDHPDGSAIGIYHTTQGTLGGSTTVGYRYDRNEVARGGLGQKNNRIVIQQTGAVLSLKTYWDAIGEYRERNFTTLGTSEKWGSIGARTDTHIAGPFRFLIEAGYDQVKPSVGDTRTMSKVTLATAISGGPDAGSRPTIRLFYTQAWWNEAARKALADNPQTQQVFGNAKDGASIGIQAEAWW